MYGCQEKPVCIFWVRSLLCGQIIDRIPNAPPHRAWECQTSHWTLRLWGTKTAGRRAFLARVGEQTGLQQFSDSAKEVVYSDLCLRWQKKREVAKGV